MNISRLAVMNKPFGVPVPDHLGLYIRGSDFYYFYILGLQLYTLLYPGYSSTLLPKTSPWSIL